MDPRTVSPYELLALLQTLFRPGGSGRQLAGEAAAPVAEAVLSQPAVREGLRHASYLDVPFDLLRQQVAPLVEDLRYGLSGVPGLNSSYELGREAADLGAFFQRIPDSYLSGGAYEPVASFGVVGDAVLDPLNWLTPGLGVAADAGRGALGVAGRGIDDLAAYRRILEDVASHADRGLPVELWREGYDGPAFLGRGAESSLEFQSNVLRRDALSTSEQVAQHMSAQNLPKFREQLGKIQENLPVIREYVERGLERRGDQWYALQDVLDTAIESAGGDPVAGRARFEFLNALEAISSSGDNPVKQHDRAMALWGLIHDPAKRHIFEDSLVFQGGRLVSGGEEYVKLLESVTAGSPSARTAMYPALQALLLRGEMPHEAMGTFKVPTFNTNLSGQVVNPTIDRHAARAALQDLTLGPPSKPADYAAVEAAMLDLANEYGMNPVDLQAALWVGASEYTGVRTTKPMQAIFMDGVERVGREMDVPATEVWRRFWNGDLPLSKILGDDAYNDLNRAMSRLIGAPDGGDEQDPEELLDMGLELGGFRTGGRF